METAIEKDLYSNTGLDPINGNISPISTQVVDGLKTVEADPQGVQRGEVKEGTLTKTIESLTTKIPSATFLTLAFGSIGISAALRLAGKKQASLFVGQWVPTILILGLYNKLVKVNGSESNLSKSH